MYLHPIAFVLTEPSRGMCMKYLNLYQVLCESEHVTVPTPLFSNPWNQASYSDEVHIMRGTRLRLGRWFVGVCGAWMQSIMALWSFCISACPCTERTVAFVYLPCSKCLLLMAECLMPRPSVRSCIAGCSPAWHMVSAFTSASARLIPREWENCFQTVCHEGGL